MPGRRHHQNLPSLTPRLGNHPHRSHRPVHAHPGLSPPAFPSSTLGLGHCQSLPQPYSRTTASPKPSWLHARAGAPPKPLQPQTRTGITQNPKAGLWHHQKPQHQHLSPTPELEHHQYYRAPQQRWSIARTSSSPTGSWHRQTLQSPTPGLASPRTPWHDHGTSSLGCYQNFPQPTTRTRAPPKPPSLKPQLESPSFHARTVASPGLSSSIPIGLGHCQNSHNLTPGPGHYQNLPTRHIGTVASLKYPSPKPGLASLNSYTRTVASPKCSQAPHQDWQHLISMPGLWHHQNLSSST